VDAFHTHAVLSRLAVAIFFPSGLKTTSFTEPLCLRGAKICLPVAVSHTRDVLSELAVATCFPSELKLTSFTELL
jgi:hypothetical protein